MKIVAAIFVLALIFWSIAFARAVRQDRERAPWRSGWPELVVSVLSVAAAMGVVYVVETRL